MNTKKERQDIVAANDLLVEKMHLAESVLFTPDQLREIHASFFQDDAPCSAQIEVVEGRTETIALEMARDGLDPVVLNFASAKKPGGGYLNGAQAQEEDLCRCSTLYYNIKEVEEYYKANLEASHLYTDNMIYSPEVLLLRDEEYRELDEPQTIAVITAPAPNAGAFLSSLPDDGQSKEQGPEGHMGLHFTLWARAGKILALAAEMEHDNILLGAWGCGVFKNDPAVVAKVFSVWLDGCFHDVFERVVFGIYAPDDKGRATLEAFKKEFAPAEKSS